MTVELINTEQLKNTITYQMENIRKVIESKTTSKEELVKLINNMLSERKILIEELDSLKEVTNDFLPTILRPESNFNLILSEIDELLFNDLQSLSSQLGMSPGQIITFLMKEFIKQYENQNYDKIEISSDNLQKFWAKKYIRITVEHHDILRVTKKDLDNVNTLVNFHNIDVLEFDIDIDLEAFMENIGIISNCGTVRVPKTFPKLLVFTKTYNCDFFDFYDDIDQKKILAYAKEANNIVEDWKSNDKTKKDNSL